MMTGKELEKKWLCPVLKLLFKHLLRAGITCTV
jgi:hypothetical protein